MGLIEYLHIPILECHWLKWPPFDLVDSASAASPSLVTAVHFFHTHHLQPYVCLIISRQKYEESIRSELKQSVIYLNGT